MTKTEKVVTLSQVLLGIAVVELLGGVAVCLAAPCPGGVCRSDRGRGAHWQFVGNGVHLGRSGSTGR